MSQIICFGLSLLITSPTAHPLGGRNLLSVRTGIFTPSQKVIIAEILNAYAPHSKQPDSSGFKPVIKTFVVGDIREKSE
jgi:hypothetical protein